MANIYSVFLLWQVLTFYTCSVFGELEGLKKELIQLKKHVSTQRRLVLGLQDGTIMNDLPTVLFEYTVEDHIFLEQSPKSLFNVHADNVCEVLDVLLSEKRIHEALEVLESEAIILEDMKSQETLSPDEITFYNSILFEKKAEIVNILKMVAETSRVSPAELLKDLIRLRRAGEADLATRLLLKHYHSRIVSKTHELQYVVSANNAYIHEAAKFAFSMISQATKSFLILNGEQSSSFPNLVQWAYEETEIFAACFNNYVNSISDINDGMLTVLEALSSAMSYCSLSETEGLVLKPCLVKHIRLCLEEFLRNHINHFKIVIGIFTSTDTWVVDRYLVSGVLGKECSYAVNEKQSEYCSLTSSGLKLIMVLQAITGYVVPLLAIQLEGHILRGLMELFQEYVSILETALLSKLNNLEKVGQEINLAETPEQQVSLLANISSLVSLLSIIIRSSFNSISHLTFEADNIIQYMHESLVQLRDHLCYNFISKVMDGNGCGLISETWVGEGSESEQFHDMMPSLVFQGLYFELIKLKNLAEDNFVEVDWLVELMRELMTALFVSISNNEELWENIAEELAINHSSNLKQFLLDLQFLVEIAKHRGYFCDNIMNASSSVLSHMEAALLSAELDPARAIINKEWAEIAAKEALLKLQKMTEKKLPTNEPIDNIEVETGESHSVCASDTSSKSYPISSQGIVSIEDSYADARSEVNSVDSISNSGDTEDGISFDSVDHDTCKLFVKVLETEDNH